MTNKLELTNECEEQLAKLSLSQLQRFRALVAITAMGDELTDKQLLILKELSSKPPHYLEFDSDITGVLEHFVVKLMNQAWKEQFILVLTELIIGKSTGEESPFLAANWLAAGWCVVLEKRTDCKEVLIATKSEHFAKVFAEWREAHLDYDPDIQIRVICPDPNNVTNEEITSETLLEQDWFLVTESVPQYENDTDAATGHKTEILIAANNEYFASQFREWKEEQNDYDPYIQVYILRPKQTEE